MRTQRSLKSAIRIAAMSAVVVAAAQLPGPAAAAPAARTSATASFTSQDESGCIMTSVSVFVRGLAGVRNGKQRSRLRLSILQVDECKGVALLDIEERVTLDAGAFQIAPGLASASLRASIPARDRASRKRFTTKLQLSWKAVEKAITAASSDEPVEPGRFQKMRQPVQRTMRMAEASGVVTANSGDLASGLAETAWLALAAGGAPAASKPE